MILNWSLLGPIQNTDLSIPAFPWVQYSLFCFATISQTTAHTGLLPPAQFSCFSSWPAADAALGHWLHTAAEGPAFDFHVSDAEPFFHFSASFLLEQQTINNKKKILFTSNIIPASSKGVMRNLTNLKSTKTKAASTNIVLWLMLESTLWLWEERGG